VASTIAGGLLAPGSRRGHDTGTIVLAVGLSILAVIGTLLPVLAAALRNRSSPVLSWLVRLLPSGWGPVAVDAAGHADWLLAAGALLGMLAVIVACALAWPQVLGRRMEGAAHPSRAAGGSRRTRLPTGGSPTGRGRRLLTGASPTGSVASKELRLWGRDPIRLTCLLIAVIVGTAVCAVPLATARTTILLPFAGLLTTVIAGACACNLYGSDGTSLWLTVLTPASSRPDARGRQLTWLILVAPYTVALTAILTAVSGQLWAWPWVLSAVPPALVLLAGQLAQLAWLRWAAVPVGLATGIAAACGLGGLASRRLAARQVAILQLLAEATRPA
jgi:ABC-2 type transport system permease protein